MKLQRACSTLLILLAATGCLSSNQVQPVTPVSSTLSSYIRQALNDERDGLSQLAMEVSKLPTEAEQKKLWMDNHDRITNEAGTKISMGIHSEITKVGVKPADIQKIWEEVSKGYAR